MAGLPVSSQLPMLSNLSLNDPSINQRGLSDLKVEFARNSAIKERQLLAQATQLENIRRQEEQAHQVHLSRLGSPASLSKPSPLIAPLLASETVNPASMNRPNHSTVLVPVGKHRDLPEPAVMVLRGLWARLGYQANSFVDMQLEIGKELIHADFSRFEREMLCNEIISLRQELDLLRIDRNEQVRRAEAAQVNLNQAIDSEQRTFKALVAEREVAKRAIERAEKGVQQVVMAKEKEAARTGVMSEEIHRLEKERLAAVLYARTAEEQAALANITAKTAAAVAMSAVHSSQAGTPRVGFAPSTPRSPGLSLPTHASHSVQPLFSRSNTPAGSIHHQNHHHSSTTPRSATIGSPHSLPPRPRTPHASVNTTTNNLGGLANDNGWTEVDEAMLQSKLRERRLEAEENVLAAEATKLAQDRLKLRFEQDRLASPAIYHPHPQTPKFTYQDLRN